MKIFPKVFFFFAVAMCLASCTNQQIYTAIQEDRQRECQKLPPSQYEECIQEHGQSYESYKKTREKILNSD